MAFITKITNLLFRPEVFFSNIAREKEHLILPALIVLIGAITTILGSIIHIVFSPQSSLDSVFANFSYSVTSGGPFIYLAPLLFWAVASISIYIVSKRLSGSGSLKVTFQNTGYSTLPSVFFESLIRLMATIAYITIEQTGDSSFTAFSNNSLGHLSIILNPAIPLFMVWSGYLCICGTKHAHQITMAKAIVAVLFGAVMVVLVNMMVMMILGT